MEPIAKTPASRSTDPVTSHQAEEHMNQSGKRGTQQCLVLEALSKWGSITSRELAEKISGMDRYDVGRRLPELKPLVRKSGERKCSISGRNATVWEITQKGKDKLACLNRYSLGA